MSKSQQRKGADGERELVTVLNEYGFKTERGGSQTFGTVPDITGLPGIHIEVKRVERLNISEAMTQAVRDAARFCDGMPTVFHRRNRQPWLVTMKLDDWVRLYNQKTGVLPPNYRQQTIILEERRVQGFICTGVFSINAPTKKGRCIMTTVEWKERIRAACIDSGSYRPAFDAVIETLADIMSLRDTALQELQESGEASVVEKTSDRGAVNLAQNPRLQVVMDLNKDALSYWKELLLRPAAKKAVVDRGKTLSDVLTELEKGDEIQ